MDGRALTVKVAHGFVILALLAVFSNNLYSLIKNVNVVTQSFTVQRKTSLVPPAMTFCITRQVAYSFTLELYGKVVATGSTPADYLSTYNNETVELTGLTNVVYKCWIIKSANDSAVIVNPSPNPNADDMRFNYTRIFDTPGRFQPADPIVLNVFDPLKQETNFAVRTLLLLDADANRAISFTRTESVYLNKTITNDITYNIIDEFRDNNTMTTPNNATSSIRISPASFDVSIVTDVVLIDPWTVVILSVTLLGVLFNFYFVLVGRGRYRPWGFINYILRYFPIEHIKERGGELSTQEEGLKSDTNMNFSEKVNEPSISEILRIYLDKSELAKYER
ncbi:3941_t:CDS:2 [Dentiscutata erythropus]|uniref:3941_t:CDS:1 n=1 Tax=Dentiscutata erythropus TaxID=1348616 RepID=A0A9N8VS32_9GLOM|nr:3941_t:CDS:2 [Dentiscutata erythropus]